MAKCIRKEPARFLQQNSSRIGLYETKPSRLALGLGRFHFRDAPAPAAPLAAAGNVA